jgi:hypothetical protein
MLKYANTYSFVENPTETPVAPECQKDSRLDWERESHGPGRDLLLQALDLVHLARCDLRLEVLELVSLLWQLTLDAIAQLDAGVNVVGDLLEILLAETS